jgi:hypothetical protein
VSLEWNGRASQELAVQVEVLSLQGEFKLHMAAALELSRCSPDLGALDTEKHWPFSARPPIVNRKNVESLI